MASLRSQSTCVGCSVNTTSSKATHNTQFPVTNIPFNEPSPLPPPFRQDEACRPGQHALAQEFILT